MPREQSSCSLQSALELAALTFIPATSILVANILGVQSQIVQAKTTT